MNDLYLHLVEGLIMLVLGTWNTRLQARSNKLIEIEVEVARMKEREIARGEALQDLRDAVADVREHMLRREDVQLIRAAMRS